jgi:DNA modification methylase
LLSDDGAISFFDQEISHLVDLDEIFGSENFRNEIIWHYKFRMMDSEVQFNRKHDNILFYSRSEKTKIDMPKEQWTRDELIKTRKQEIIVDDEGKEWIWMPGQKGNSKSRKVLLEDILGRGKAIDDVWPIPIISSSAKERTGYPTQKPEELIERIIISS